MREGDSIKERNGVEDGDNEDEGESDSVEEWEMKRVTVRERVIAQKRTQRGTQRGKASGI